jgi:hypothetical protein
VSLSKDVVYRDAMTNLFGMGVQSLSDISKVEKFEDKLSSFAPPLPSFLILCLLNVSVALLPCFEMREGTVIYPKSPLAYCSNDSSKSPIKTKQPASPAKKVSGSKDQVFSQFNLFSR